MKDVSDPQHDGKVQLCHNGNTISISQNAVAAHLAHLLIHADTFGPCSAFLTCAPACNNNTVVTPLVFTDTTSAIVTVNNAVPQLLTVTAYPNPFQETITVKVDSDTPGAADIIIL